MSTLMHLRSAVCKHFGLDSINGKIIDKDKAVCRLCMKQVLYNNVTTTTNGVTC